MTEQDTGQRRREDDFKLHPEESTDLFPGKDRRRSRGAPRVGKSFLKRFRNPIVGLSIAGAAAPLINAGGAVHHDDENRRRTEGSGTEAQQARMAVDANAGDAEDRLASQIAEESANVETSSVVGAAMETYNIDKDLAQNIYDIAQKEGIEPKLAYGLVHTESSFQTKARSGVGARGLTQVMPKTAKWLMPGTKADDLWDQKTNLSLGFRYLNQLIDKYHGNVRHALLAYNRGPGTVDKILRKGGDPNNGYADKVIKGSKFGV